jgi:hypothetical protein
MITLESPEKVPARGTRSTIPFAGRSAGASMFLLTVRARPSCALALRGRGSLAEDMPPVDGVLGQRPIRSDARDRRG